MNDFYRGFTQSAIGSQLDQAARPAQPREARALRRGRAARDRHRPGRRPGRVAESLVGILDGLGIAAVDRLDADATYKGLVFDATGLTSADELVELRDFFTPLLHGLDPCPRVVVIGTPPEQTDGAERVAQRALEGFTRSLGKEIGRGGTVQLAYVAAGSEGSVASTLAFLLSPKSAYVSGQVIRIGAYGAAKPGKVGDWARPLEGKVAVVTGASRGIGEQIARVLHRDGATVVGIDVPQAASELQGVMRELDGDHLALDITAKDAPQRIAHHLQTKHGGVDVVVHNAGITRDRKLANMAPSARATSGRRCSRST